jgi:hypothetical protein
MKAFDLMVAYEYAFCNRVNNIGQRNYYLWYYRLNLTQTVVKPMIKCNNLALEGELMKEYK